MSADSSSSLPRWLRLTGISAAVLLVVGGAVLGAYYLASQAPVFGVPSRGLISIASLSLLSLSVIIGLLGAGFAFYGWPEVKKVIRRRVKTELEGARNEYLGNVQLTQGVLYGRLSREETGKTIKIVNPRYLERAVTATRIALDRLKKTDQPGVADELALLKAKNNLAFYYALVGDATYGPHAVELADDLTKRKEFGENPEPVNTYLRVVAEFYEFFDHPRKRVIQACSMAESLLRRPDVRLEKKKNARRHLEALRRAQSNLEEESVRG